MTPDKVNIEILSGEHTSQQVDMAELRPLIDLVGEHEYVGDNFPTARTREEVKAVLDSLNPEQREAVGRYQDGISKKISALLPKGDVLVARINGETVGMIRAEKRASAPGNGYIEGEFYEIGSAGTLGERQGLGVYRQLREAIVNHVQSKYGPVAMLSGTKRDGIKKLNDDDGWTEIGTGGYCAIHGIGVPEEAIAASTANGNTAFLWRPDVEGARNTEDVQGGDNSAGRNSVDSGNSGES